MPSEILPASGPEALPNKTTGELCRSCHDSGPPFESNLVNQVGDFEVGHMRATLRGVAASEASVSEGRRLNVISLRCGAG